MYMLMCVCVCTYIKIEARDWYWVSVLLSVLVYEAGHLIEP